MSLTFQRARRPEQIEARRAAILAAAQAMLAEKSVAAISLRELSERVGLAKSNVLRYFDSREAIFLEVLNAECQDWLAELDTELGRPWPRKAQYANEIRVATAIAGTLTRRTLLCELLGAMAGVLERNISADCAHDFKARALGNIEQLAEVVARHLPWLAAEAVAVYAEGVFMLVAGMFPFSTPTEPVRAAMADMGMPDPEQRFVSGLGQSLTTWLIGASVQSSSQ